MKQIVPMGRRAFEAAKPSLSSKDLCSQMINRIALLSTGIQKSGVKVPIFLNPQDYDLLCVSPELTWCSLNKDESLRPGVCRIEGIGKKEIYYQV